jgi:hypothetical protein
MKIKERKYITLPNAILFLSVLLSIGTILALFSSFTEVSYHTFFNTDTLYLPSLYKDLFIDHNALKGWHFNPAPNFFPDMIMYFLLMAITPNFLVTSFIYSIIQYLFFIYLIYRLFKAINLPNLILATSLSVLLLLLFFMVAFYSNDFNFTFYLISNSYHTGAFLMSLLCTILSLEYLKTKKTSLLVYLGIISFLCVISDRLFIILYCIPWVLVLLFYFKINERKKLLWINLLNVITVVIGITAFNLLRDCKYIYIDPPHRIMEYKYIGECFKLLINQMYVYITDCNFKSTIIIVSTITFISLIFISFKNLVTQKRLDIKGVYYILSIVFTIVVFLAPVINGNYTGWDTFRYNIYVFYMLILNSGVIIYFLIRKINIIPTKILYSLIIILILGASLNIAYKFNPAELKNYFNYYPKNVKSIDEISKKIKLYSGVGSYWDSKVVNMFSKNGVRVYAVLNTIDPYCHVMNENWYFKGQFNFVVAGDVKQDSTVLSGLFNNKIQIIKSENVNLIVTPKFGYNDNYQKVDLPDTP